LFFAIKILQKFGVKKSFIRRKIEQFYKIHENCNYHLSKISKPLQKFSEYKLKIT